MLPLIGNYHFKTDFQITAGVMKLGMSLRQPQQGECSVLLRKFRKDSKNMSIVFGKGWPTNYIA